MEQKKEEQTRAELSSQIVTILTTEHYSLQSGRTMTVTDTNGRCTLFIGTVSSALIAIAFAGQASHLGMAFFVFSLVLFPSLFIMGLFTYERVLQAGIEDLIYARGMTNIRKLYLKDAPQLKPYFILSARDASGEPLLDEGINPSWWQVFLTAAGMIAFINGILLGVFLALLLAVLSFPLMVCTGAGVVAFLVSFGILQRHQWQHWKRLKDKLAVLLRSQPV